MNLKELVVKDAVDRFNKELKELQVKHSLTLEGGQGGELLVRFIHDDRKVIELRITYLKEYL